MGRLSTKARVVGLPAVVAKATIAIDPQSAEATPLPTSDDPELLDGLRRTKKVTMRAVVAVLLGGIALAGFAGHAHAVVIDSNLQCTNGANPSTNSDTNGTVSTFDDLSVTDVTLNLTNASDCYGPYSQDNSGDATLTADVNDVFGPGLFLLDKSDTDVVADLDGINFEVTASGPNAGTWTISWTDTNGPNPANLPLGVDLVVLLKDGGKLYGLYLFDDFLLPVSPNNYNGAYDIIWNNPGGQQGALSHLSLFGRITTTVQVPEPSSIAMFTAGLLGMVLFLRRRRAT